MKRERRVRNRQLKKDDTLINILTIIATTLVIINNSLDIIFKLIDMLGF